jgi:hypothetical protein
MGHGTNGGALVARAMVRGSFALHYPLYKDATRNHRCLSHRFSKYAIDCGPPSIIVATVINRREMSGAICSGSTLAGRQW